MNRLANIPLDFDFLAWVDRFTHFPDSFEEKLIELGMDAGEAFFVVRSDAVKVKHSIVAVYQAFGDAYSEFLDAYIAECWITWQKLQSRD